MTESEKLARTFLGQEVSVTIDRPLGTKHSKHGYEYPVNYGYIEGTLAPDGAELDAYVLGVDEPLRTFSGTCIAFIHREDDDDDKLIVAPANTTLTDQQILDAVHFQEQWFKHTVIR